MATSSEYRKSETNGVTTFEVTPAAAPKSGCLVFLGAAFLLVGLMIGVGMGSFVGFVVFFALFGAMGGRDLAKRVTRSSVEGAPRYRQLPRRARQY